MAFGSEKLKAKEVKRVPDDGITVALGLPQLKILQQKETLSLA